MHTVQEGVRCDLHILVIALYFYNIQHITSLLTLVNQLCKIETAKNMNSILGENVTEAIKQLREGGCFILQLTFIT